MRRWIYLGVSWLVLSGLLAGLLTCPRVQKGMLPIARLLVTWDLNLSDRLLATLPPLKADPDFLFLGIDDSSMAMGEEDPEVVSRIRPLSLMAEPFPWSREVWATATERLLDAGARLVVIDLLLVAPGKGDAALQAVLDKHADRVVLASSLSPPATSQGFAGGFGSLVDPSETILPGEGNALAARTEALFHRPDASFRIPIAGSDRCSIVADVFVPEFGLLLDELLHHGAAFFEIEINDLNAMFFHKGAGAGKGARFTDDDARYFELNNGAGAHVARHER